jgi:hypothetical protein
MWFALRRDSDNLFNLRLDLRSIALRSMTQFFCLEPRRTCNGRRHKSCCQEIPACSSTPFASRPDHLPCSRQAPIHQLLAPTSPAATDDNYCRVQSGIHALPTGPAHTINSCARSTSTRWWPLLHYALYARWPDHFPRP